MNGKHEALNHDSLLSVMKLTLDKNNIILDVNSNVTKAIGMEAKDLIGKHITSLYTDKSKSPTEFLYRYQYKQKPILRRELQYKTQSGRNIWLKESLHQDPTTQNIIMICEDMSDIHFLAKEYEYQVYHDGLTELYNRNYLERELGSAINELRQRPSLHSLVYVDLDQFKLINDTICYEAGDAAIVYTAELLKSFSHKGIRLFRVGGDEFMLLKRHTSRERTVAFAHRVQKTLSESKFTWNGIQLHLHCSVGIRLIDDVDISAHAYQTQVATACRLAKEEGGNQVRKYRADDERFTQRELEMQCVNQVYDAITEDRVELYAQQIKNLNDTGEKIYFEVLVRLRDENGEMMSPAVFIPALERYNLASVIDREVFRKTLTWLETHPEMLDNIGRCSINLSGQSIGDESFNEFLLHLLAESSVPCEKICVEITETAAVNSLKQAQALFIRLKKLGCTIALDDFGSGLSSFAYLKALPIDVVKIDGTFVRNMHENIQDHNFVVSIHDLVVQMGKKTVAEFVDNQSVMDLLVAGGINYAQGYLINEPIPLEELITQLMAERKLNLSHLNLPKNA